MTPLADGDARDAPVVAGGMVVVSAGLPYETHEGQPGALLAFDAATGEQAWRKDTAKWPVMALAAAGTDAFAFAPPATLRAIDAKTGRERWKHVAPVGCSAFGIGVHRDVLALSLCGERLGIVAATGREAWRRPESRGKLAAAGAGVLVFRTDGGLEAADLATGATRWTWARPDATPGPVASDAGAVFLANAATVVAIDATTGRERWTTTGSHPVEQLWSSPTSLWVASGDRLVEVDPADGKVRQSWHVPAKVLFPITTVGDVKVFFDANGNLHGVR